MLRSSRLGTNLRFAGLWVSKTVYSIHVDKPDARGYSILSPCSTSKIAVTDACMAHKTCRVRTRTHTIFDLNAECFTVLKSDPNGSRTIFCSVAHFCKVLIVFFDKIMPANTTPTAKPILGYVFVLKGQ